MPTIPGIVPEEWATFKKSVIEYNLMLNLYKKDLDWKKAHMNAPTKAEALHEYHLRIGQVNQHVGAVAIMECVIGKYIATVGKELITKQA